MQVHRGLSSIQRLPPSVVTSGTFDGLHFGHKKIIQRLKEVGEASDLETVVITFWPHPRFVLGKDADSLKLLSTLDEKIRLFSQLGIDHLIIIEFNKQFSSLTSSEFIQNILKEKVNTKKLVIGYDHRFGRNREGGFDYLMEHQKELGFSVEEIPKQELEEVGVSSTKIRNALQEGDVEMANKYLGRNYRLTGLVVKGNQLGRTINFPTANIQVDASYKLVPNTGIYAVRVEIKDKIFNGMMNIGYRPTVSEEKIKSLEVNIFNFNKDIYNETLTIHFVKLLRQEQKFSDVNALKKQLEIDKSHAEKVLPSVS